MAALASSKIVKYPLAPLAIQISSEIRDSRIHHDHVHPVAQVHISRQGHQVPFLQPAHHLITRRVRDAHVDLPLLQYRFAPAQLVFLHHEHVPPRATTCFGMISVFPTQLRLGSASQVIFTGWFGSSAPSSGSSINARTRTLRRSAISASKSPSFTKSPALAGSEYSVPSTGAAIRPFRTLSCRAATSCCACCTCSAARSASSRTARSNSCFAAVSRVTSACAFASARSFAASSSWVAACCAINRNNAS